MILKLSELRVIAFTKFEKESEKAIVTLCCSQHNQVAITLS